MDEIKKKLTKRDIYTLIGLCLIVGALLYFGTASRATNTRSVSADIRDIESQCSTQKNETCYGDAFGKLTTATNRDYAFTVLRELQKTEPAARGCHFIAHAISIAETKKDPTKWKELMNTAPQDCSYGASHGVLEVYASTFPDGKLPASEIKNICNNPDTNNCTHILGHLLLVMDNNDIPKSTALCETLPNGANDKFECLTGVYMERITAFNLVEHDLADKSALDWPARLPELTALCKAQTGTFMLACWKEIAHVAAVTFNNDPQKVYDFCRTGPSEAAARLCIDHSIGILGGAYNFNISQMGPICDATVADEPDFKNRCYANVVAATLSTIPQDVADVVGFCNKVDTQYQSTCFAMIGNTLYRASADSKAAQKSACATAPADFQNACELGGSTTVEFSSGV